MMDNALCHRLPQRLIDRVSTVNQAKRLFVLLLLAALGGLTDTCFAKSPPRPPPPPPPPPATVSSPSTVAADLTKAFTEGMAAFQAGDYATAVSKLEMVLAKAGDVPELEPVYFTLGASYYNLAQYPKAIETFNKYVEKFPSGSRIVDATFSIGQAKMLLKDYAGAAAQFAKLENVPQAHDQALLYEGLAWKEGGKVDDAIKALEKLVSPGIQSASAANAGMVLAALYTQKREGDKGNALVQKVLQNTDLVDNMMSLNAMAIELGDNLLDNQSATAALAAYRSVRSREEVIAFQEAKVAAAQKNVAQALAAIRANPSQFLQFVALRDRLQAELDKAQKLSDEAKKLPDLRPGLLLRIGRCFYQLDKRWESIVAFNAVVTKYPSAAERETALFQEMTAYADVNQPKLCQQLCEQYLKEYPKGPNAGAVGYLDGAVALQANDLKGAESAFGSMLERQPDSAFREQMRFLLGNAKFMEGKYDEAANVYRDYLKEYPSGHFAEEAEYRSALTLVFNGKYEPALGLLNAYLRKYPHGQFAADAKYRVMVCKYAASLFDEIIADAKAWQQEFPQDQMEGEVLALLGDSLVGEGKDEAAIPIYVESEKKAYNDEVVNYSLFEASKLMQKLGRWNDVSRLFEEFVKEKPDSPSVVTAIFWIGKAKAHEGRMEEAKQFLVGTLKQYIQDPARESVEQLLQQLAQFCSKRPRPAPAAPAPSPAAVAAADVSPSPASSVPPTPAPLPPYDAAAELDKQLAPLDKIPNPTAKARLFYARAELAQLLKKPAERAKYFAEIEKFKPEELSPVLLAQAGDDLLAKGEAERAATLYSELRDAYPKSDFLDYAYVGLGEIAFAQKNYTRALELFTYAADELAGSKVKDATVGEAKSCLELGNYDKARKLFEQIASVREWRGESTAYAVYSLGEVEARQQHWPEAIAYFQRVFVLYQKYLPWVAKSYIRSAEGFDKLGKRPEAVNHLKEMLRNPKLENFPETEQARRMLQQWGAA